MSGAQGTETAAEHSQRARWFRLPAAMSSVTARVRAAFVHSRSAGHNDVEDRIRKIEAELEQARRLDGSTPPRRQE